MLKIYIPQQNPLTIQWASIFQLLADLKCKMQNVTYQGNWTLQHPLKWHSSFLGIMKPNTTISVKLTTGFHFGTTRADRPLFQQNVCLQIQGLKNSLSTILGLIGLLSQPKRISMYVLWPKWPKWPEWPKWPKWPSYKLVVSKAGL